MKKGDKIKLVNASDRVFYTSSREGDIGIVNYADSYRVFLDFINDIRCDKKWKIEDVELINDNNFKLLNYNHY